MCGRYVSPDEASIEREFTLVRAEWQFPPSYNVAPTQNVPAVRVNKAGERTGALLHWGLIPYWAKGAQPQFSTINATVEKITDAAIWRGPCARAPSHLSGMSPSSGGVTACAQRSPLRGACCRRRRAGRCQDR